MFDGVNIRLRVLELGDAETVYKNFNNLELRAYLSNRSPKSMEDETAFIKRSWKSNNSGNLSLGIEVIEDKKLIGTIGCWAKWQFSGSYELGIAIWDPEFRSKGYGTEAMWLLLFHAFETMNIHRMQLHVFSFNKVGIKAYKKIGFKEVGRLREADFLFNKYHDLIIMDLLKQEVTYPDELENKFNELRNIVRN